MVCVMDICTHKISPTKSCLNMGHGKTRHKWNNEYLESSYSHLLYDDRWDLISRLNYSILRSHMRESIKKTTIAVLPHEFKSHNILEQNPCQSVSFTALNRDAPVTKWRPWCERMTDWLIGVQQRKVNLCQLRWMTKHFWIVTKSPTNEYRSWILHLYVLFISVGLLWIV